MHGAFVFHPLPGCIKRKRSETWMIHCQGTSMDLRARIGKGRVLTKIERNKSKARIVSVEIEKSIETDKIYFTHSVVLFVATVLDHFKPPFGLCYNIIKKCRLSTIIGYLRVRHKCYILPILTGSFDSYCPNLGMCWVWHLEVKIPAGGRFNLLLYFLVKLSLQQSYLIHSIMRQLLNCASLENIMGSKVRVLALMPNRCAPWQSLNLANM